MGYTENQVYTPAIKQLMKGIEERTRKVRGEEDIWDLKVLISHI
jgi:hypothetical protein